MPGVFIDNRYPTAVNGSLWVIPIFFGSYLFFLSLKLLGLLKESYKSAVFMFLIMFTAIIFKFFKINVIWASENESFYIILSILFGSALCCLRNEIEVDKKLFIGSLLLFIIFRGTYLHYPIKLLFIFLTCLYISHIKYFLFVKPKINISLGLFLYAFPVQQSISNIFMQSTPYFNFFTSLFITIIIAILSNYFIEKYAYRMADKINEFIDNRKWIL